MEVAEEVVVEETTHQDEAAVRPEGEGTVGKQTAVSVIVCLSCHMPHHVWRYHQ